jgi:prepilin-type N-terminal cleavage/methylation domain-containing protein
MKKAFTLIELVITMVILSLLIGVLFEIFIMISHISVKIQHERGLHDESIYVIQSIQNIIDQ